MANLIYKIMKKTTLPPFLRIITTTTPKTPLLPIFHTPNSEFTNNNPIPTVTVKPTTKAFNLQQFCYPSLPFAYCLNPIPTTGFNFHPMEADDGNDGRTMWADSVKKKRKRKMNKHKYRKRMKLLRRNSRNKS